MSWRQLKEMSERGHEISNHSWSHGKLVLMSPEEARRNIGMNDSAIARNVGKKPVTICLKGDWKGKKVKARQGGKKIKLINTGDSLLLTILPSAAPIRCHID